MKTGLFTVVLCCFAALCLAAEPEPLSYKPMNSGVEIVFNADGRDWQQIKAFGEADLNFGDKADIRQARKKAVLRAKADLSKFLTEKIKTEETSEEITKMCRTASAKNGATADEEATRKIVDTTIEKIVNQSEAILKGILELESAENSEKHTVRVIIGVSRKTMAIADSVGNAIKGNASTPAGQSPPAPVGSTVRKSRNADNF